VPRSEALTSEFFASEGTVDVRSAIPIDDWLQNRTPVLVPGLATKNGLTKQADHRVLGVLAGAPILQQQSGN